MKFLSTASLVIAALAAPILGTPVENRGYGKKCLTDEEATGIVKLWSAAFGGSVEAARKVAAENIEVYDNTVNFLFNMTIDTPYIKGIDNGGSTTAPPGMVQVASSPKPHYDAKFEVITMLHDCDSISFRWRFVGKSAGVDPTSTNKPGDLISYNGIDLMEVDTKRNRVTKAYSAFEALNMLYQLGIKICFQKDNPNACF